MLSIIDWNDEEFVKKRNQQELVDNNRVSLQESGIGSCAWCGCKFIKKHHSEKYCSEKCRNDARGQQSRNKAHRWYHKHKHELTEKQRWGLGSGTLGSHMHSDFEKEQSVIQKEFSRLKIKRK